jgi:hypothetical protein
MTRFKEMTMDEQIETIEHIAQEAHRVREENNSTKEIKSIK